jgi:4-azaleucine resistance transporter AzlC
MRRRLSAPENKPSASALSHGRRPARERARRASTDRVLEPTLAGPRTATLREGVRAALPFALASLGFGISYGVLARASGMGSVAPVVMSLTTWGGGAQFVAASLLAGGAGAASAALAALLLQARYAGMAFALLPSIPGGRGRSALTSLAIVDESWALAARPDGSFDLSRLLGAAMALYVGWNAGTALGVLAGDLIADPRALGLDAAFPALFLALLASTLSSRQAVAVAAAAAATAATLTPLTAPGIPILAAATAAAISLRRLA